MINRKGIDDLRNKVFTGVVEEVNDKYKRGKIKIRVKRVYDEIPLDDIPWAVPHDQQAAGKTHILPEKGKVVKVIFPDGDWYHPEYFSSFHYNINLQDKLESLSDSEYSKFHASYYDDEHQYFLHPKDGMMFDYVKSHFNIKPNGDIAIALRDDKSFMYIGSTEGDQPALMSDHWMKWFDKLVDNLMGSKGGPYLGNLGAPVLANPALLQVLNEYYAIRQTFLSTNVWIVDNNEIKPQDRKFDNKQRIDNTSENEKAQDIPKVSGYQPQQKQASKAPKQDGAPNNIANATITEPADTLPPPVDGPFENGKLPLSKLTKSRYLANGSSNMSRSSGGFDTEAYLIDEATQSFDAWMNIYNQEKDTSWPDIIFTDGYRTLERQEGMYKNNPTRAPKPGTSDHGWAICVDMYWGANPDVPSSVDVTGQDSGVNTQVYNWLKSKGAVFGFFNEDDRTPGRTDWWNWRYDRQKKQISAITTGVPK